MALSYGHNLISADDIVPLLVSSTGLLVLIFLLFVGVCLLNREEFSAHAQPRLYAGVFLALLIGANFRFGFAGLTAAEQKAESPVIQAVYASSDLGRLRRSLTKIPPQTGTILLLTERRDTARLRLELVIEFQAVHVVEISEWEAVYERINRDAESDSVVLIEWGEFPPDQSKDSHAEWLRQTIAQVPRFNGTDLLIHRLIRVAHPR